MTVVEPNDSVEPEPRSGAGGEGRPAVEPHRGGVVDAFERVLEEDGGTIHRGLD